MAELKDALDHNRFQELCARSVLATNLWLSLNLAAMRGDAGACKDLWKSIRTVSVDAGDLLKALGTERDDG